MVMTMNFLNKLSSLLEEDYGSEKTTQIMNLHGITKLDPIENYEKCYEDANGFTVDPNSNVASATPSRILAEMLKPHIKLVSLYKIYEWLNKIGADADTIMKSILSGELYVHDLSVGMNLPYTYCKDEVVLAKYKGKELLVSFEELYNIVDAPEESVEDGVYIKRPEDCYVYDKNGFVKVLLLTKKLCNRDMHFIRNQTGRTVVVTDNHPMITDSGECMAKDCIDGKQLLTIYPKVELNSEKQVDERFGYILGVLVSSGVVDIEKNIIKVKTNGITFGKLVEYLDGLGINYILLNSLWGERFIYISDDKLFGALRDLGFYKGGFGFIVSPFITSFDLKFIRSFIDGVHDALCNVTDQLIETDNRTLLNKLSYLAYFAGWYLYEVEPLSFADRVIYRARLIKSQADFIEGWNKVVDNIIVNINHDYIYDITTSTTTLIVNGMFSHNCVSLQTLKLLIDGQEWETLPSAPPRWASTYTEQVKESIMCMSQSCTGAINPADFFICYFIVLLDEFMRSTQRKTLNDSTLKAILKQITTRSRYRKKIENDFQRFIYPLNRPFRIAHQSPFTNITVSDRASLETIMENFSYFDFIRSRYNTSELNKNLILDCIVELEYIFAQLMAKKDPITGLPIRFPVLTLSITVDEHKNILDKDFFERFIALNTEGLFNIYISDLSTMKLMQCCRFKMDLDEVFGKGLDSFGNGGLGIGSRRVVTVNLARCAYDSKGDINKFFALLEDRLNKARAILEAHRQYLISILDTIPIFKYGWLNIDRTFGTFGIVAFTEAVEYLGFDLIDENGRPNYDFVQYGAQILDFISNKVSEFSKQDGLFYNIEQIPAEGAAVLLATIDNFIYDFNPNDRFIYSNQFVPLWYDVDLFTKIEIESNFYKYLSGGGITHLNVAGRLSPSQTKALTKYAIGSSLEHFAINPNFCVCENGHVSIGKFESCPTCGAFIKENVTRVVGYFTPVSNWNKGRKKEYKIRYWNKIQPKHATKDQVARLEKYARVGD